MRARGRAIVLAGLVVGIGAAACNDLIGLTPGTLVSDGGGGAASTCGNGKKDGDETGKDCGGPCDQGCSDGEGCKVGTDCQSKVCGASGTCKAPACDDTEQNGDETGEDCGGTCGPCSVGEGCKKPDDCKSGDCDAGTCVPSCDDGEKSGEETGVDCGGTTCDPCAIGDGCQVGTDCETGVCEGKKCTDFHVWSYAYGGMGTEKLEKGVVDDAGNLLLTGSFIGDFSFANTTFNNESGIDLFLAKVDPNGTPLWALSFPGDPDLGLSFVCVAVGSNGDAVLAGGFQKSLKFGNTTLQGLGGFDMFVGAVHSSGYVKWIQQFGNGEAQAATAVAVDSAGGVLMAGQVDGVVDFGGGDTPDSGGADVVVLKLDPQGNWLWNRRFPSAGIESVRSITTDSAKNIIVSGLFSTTIDFGGGILATAGGDDIFLLKLDSSGQHLWSRRFGSVGADFEMTAEVDAEGNLYLSGISQESLDLGCGTMPSAGDKDIVIAKLDPSGECLWSKRYGDDNAQDAVSLAVLPDGGVVASGHFRGKLDLGALSLSAPGDGAALAYVFRLDQDACAIGLRLEVA